MSTPTDAAPPQPAPKRGMLFRFSAAVDRAMRLFFFRVGYLVAGRPLYTIALSLLLTAALLAGMLRFRSESRAGKLWVPQGTVALKNQAYVEANYGQSVRTSNIAFVPGEDALASRAGMLQMLAVAEQGYGVEVEVDGEKVTFQGVCEETQDEAGNVLCWTESVFDLFYDEERIVKKDGGRVDYFATVRALVEDLSDDEIRERLENPAEDSPVDGRPFNAEQIIAAEGSGSSFKVNLLRYTQFAEKNAVLEGGELVDESANRLEEAWADLLLEDSELLKNSGIEWFVESEFSQDDSLAQALTSDLPLLSGGFVLLGIYVVLFLGDFHAVRSHMLLALAAIAMVGLALGACFGISSALGMFFGPVHQILPLLIIGIGIDDCFHVTRAVDEVHLRDGADEKPVRLKVALGLSASGSSITVTSFTNVVVFLLSAISKLPALRYFALWAAFGIFFAWLFAISFYTAFLTLDLRRQRAKRRDCCPCFPPVANVKERNWFGKPAGGFSRFFRNQYGPFITRPLVRIVLLVLFAAGLAAGCYGVSQLYLKFDFSFFYPAGSAQREYQDQIDKYFKLGFPTNVYVQDRDLSTEENQRALLELCAPDTGVIARNKWIQGDTVSCWYPVFRASEGVDGNAVVPSAGFASRVKAFIGQEGARFADDILFDEDESTVIGCRIRTAYVYRASNREEIESLESVREDADSVGFGDVDGSPAAFPYTFFDTFSEQYAALPGEIGISLGLASVAVALVCFVLVGHPLVALVCVFVVGVVIVDVLGLTYYSDVQLNSVSVITLVLCTGISVDFVVHIARSFLEQVGTRSERAVKSLGTMGPPVFYAGFSTFLAIVVLALAKSYIFQVIFKGFLFLIIMGFLHGLILTPLILSLIGPPSFFVDEADKEKSEKLLEETVTGGMGSDTDESILKPGGESSEPEV